MMGKRRSDASSGHVARRKIKRRKLKIKLARGVSTMYKARSQSNVQEGYCSTQEGSEGLNHSVTSNDRGDAHHTRNQIYTTAIKK